MKEDCRRRCCCCYYYYYYYDRYLSFWGRDGEIKLVHVGR